MHRLMTPLQRAFLGVALLLGLVACESGASPSPDTAPVGEAAANPTPAPTVPPAPELLDQALAHRAIGDDDKAAVDLHTLVDTYPTAPEARPARYYLAESFARRGRWTSAVAVFKTFVTDPIQDDLTPLALFWLARGYEEAGDWANAAATYERYRTFNTPLEPYAAMRQAALQQVLGQTASAAQNYEHSASVDIARGERAGSYEKAIALRRQLGQDDIALQLYDQLLALADQPAYRARILAEAAALARSLGQADQARGWLLDLVTDVPATPQAAAAAEQLLAAGDPAVPAGDAARIFFSNDRFAEALPLFDAAIAQARSRTPASETNAEVLELQRLRAMTLRALGNFPEALDALAAVGNARPDSEPGRQALLDWIQTLGQSGEVQRAADAYREYANSYSSDPRAPEALDRAAQLLDRLGNAEEAVQVRLELGQRYPQSDQAPAAVNTAAMYHFRAGRWEAAQRAWQQLADQRQGVERARGAFWAARAAQQREEAEQARALFELVFAAAPDSYYGARAVEELALPITTTLVLGTPITEQAWQALETWVAGWSGQPVFTVSEQGYDPDVSESGFVQRALALEQVGLGPEAIAEWNNARTRWADDPTRLMQVARLAHEHNVPYIELKAAEQLAALAPKAAQPQPEALRRMIFPTPYTDLVIEAAQAQGVDPRLLYALLRQESLFNAGATSWVGARGLAQVMPATGEGIAQRLAISGFQIDDLYRPYVSVRFGAFYLGQQIQSMQDSVHGGLAAYNGGPGNAQRWADGTQVVDPDLFTEGIDYAETRNYVKLVYGYYGAYQRLYALP